MSTLTAESPSRTAARVTAPTGPGDAPDADSQPWQRAEARTGALDLVVVNRADALARVTGLLARHRCDIEELSFDATDDPDVARIHLEIAVDADHGTRPIARQLARLLDVIETSAAA